MELTRGSEALARRRVFRFRDTEICASPFFACENGEAQIDEGSQNGIPAQRQSVAVINHPSKIQPQIRATNFLFGSSAVSVRTSKSEVEHANFLLSLTSLHHFKVSNTPSEPVFDKATPSLSAQNF